MGGESSKLEEEGGAPAPPAAHAARWSARNAAGVRVHPMGRHSCFKFVAGEKSSSLQPSIAKSPEDTEFIGSVLRRNPNFLRLIKLNDDHIQRLVDGAWKEDFAQGQMLMSEGDLSNQIFYIVIDGSVEMVAYTPFEIIEKTNHLYCVRPEEPDGPMENKPKTLRTCGRGLCIGDRSMVFNQPRLVTAQAKERTTVWAISQSDFRTVQLQAMQDLDTSEDHSKHRTPEEELLIKDAVRLNANLQRLVPLSQDYAGQIASVACRLELAEGHVLMYEGDLNAEAFYIITEGSMEAIGSEPFEVVSAGEGRVSYFDRAAHTGQSLPEAANAQTIRIVGCGHCFGEISMLHCAPRFATMKAVKRTVLWAIDRANFQIIQMKAAEEQMRRRVVHLENSAVASSLPQAGKEALAGLMDVMRFVQGELMLRCGTSVTALYILYQGVVEISDGGEDSESKRLEADQAQGTRHYFGEEALRKDVPHPVTVKVISEVAMVLVLERADFMAVWDQLIEGIEAPTFERLYTRVGPRKNALINSNLSKVGLLGCGTFGPVELVRHKTTGETYALKTMSKGLLVLRGMIATVARERDISEMLSSPFIIKLAAAFSDPQTVGLLLEPALGGELGDTYRREGLYGSAGHAKYYLSGVVLALECLHRLKVAYRDLRPEAVLLTQLGHPKLSDVGLAKIVIGQTFTICGTPDYMAPEVLAGTGHARAVDWWGFGVLAFELMAGYPPFESDHPMRVYWNLMRGIARVDFPTACQGPVGDLIKDLLKPQAIDRLPMRQGGISNVMEHEWFAGFDWSAMRALTLTPPYVPNLQGNTDLSNFTARKELLPEPVELSDEDGRWQSEFEEAGFI